MKQSMAVGSLALVLALFTLGCGAQAEKPAPEAKATPTKDPEIEKALAKLSPEARKRAEAQKECPVSGHALGSMDAPVEVKIEGEPVFICCEHCRKAALKDPAKTLAKVKELKGGKE